MLEILGIILLCNKNKANALARGRKPGGFVALTICLWVGLEIIGGAIGAAAELGFGTYLIAIVMAAIGGVTSYLIAKNCKPGNYVPPAQTMAQNIAKNAEPLSIPAQLTIVREGSMVGAAVSWSFFLNGNGIGSLGNGKMLSVATGLKRNMLVAKDVYGSELPPFVFEVEPGANAQIHFKANKFLPEKSMGVLPVSGVLQQSMGDAPAKPASQHEPTAAQTAQAAFCYKCGAPLTEGASFCAKCGQRRFEAEMPAYPAGNSSVAPVFAASTGEKAKAAEAVAKPMRAVWAGVWLIGAWLLVFLLHSIPGMKLLYCSAASYIITSALLGVGVYLLLQKGIKWKTFAAAAFVLAALLDALNGSLIQMNSLYYGRFRLEGLFNSPAFSADIAGCLLGAAVAAGCAVLFGWLLRNKNTKQRLLQTALYTALAVLAFNLVYVFSTSPTLLRNPISILAILISYLFTAGTLFLAPLALGVFSAMRQEGVSLSGWGIVWCWLGAVGMLVSFGRCIGAAATFFTPMYSSQLLLSVAALAGFIMLIAHKRLGWYFILFSTFIALLGQFESSFIPVIQGAANFIPLMIGAILGAANPVITWFSIKSAWIGNENFETPLKTAVYPARKQYNKFDKFVAIFNLCVGGFFIVFPFFFVLDGSSFQTSMLASIIPGMLFVGYSIACLCVMKHRYPTWMKVLGIVLFSIAALILLIVLVTALAQI